MPRKSTTVEVESWIKADRSELLRILGPADRIAPKRSTLPIASALLIHPDGWFEVTDGKCWLKQQLNELFQIEKPIAVNCAKFTQIVKALGEDIEIELRHPKLILRSGKSKYDIPVLAQPEDFQFMPELPEDGWSELPDGAIDEILALKDYVSKEETKVALTGIYLNLGQTIKAAASNEYVFSCYESESGFEEPKGELIVPATFAAVCSAIDLQEAQILTDQMGIYLKTKDTVFVGRRLDAVFVKYEKLFQNELNWQVTIDIKTWKTAIERVKSVFDSDSPIVVEFTGEEAVLRMSDASGQVGVETIECESDPLKIKFKPSYLLDLFRLYEGDVAIGVPTPVGRPPLFLTSPKSSYKSFLMTMQLMDGD